MISQKKVKKILDAYYDLQFPNSYGGVAEFRKSLKNNRGIEISQRALRNILKNESLYQAFYVRKKTLFDRHLYARGVGIEAFADIAYLNYPTPSGSKEFIFLACIDIFSKYLWTEIIPENKVNPKSVKKAFLRLFKRGMPHFSILRVDRDPSIWSIRSIFSKLGMLLQVKRGPHYMATLDNVIKQIEGKMMKYLVAKPHSSPKRLVQEVTVGFNNTVQSSHCMTPKEVRIGGGKIIDHLEYKVFQANNPVLDPLIRKRLYPDQHLEPFDSFLKKQLRLQKKVNTPRSEDLPVEMSEKYDTFRVGDKVILNFGPDSLSVRLIMNKHMNEWFTYCLSAWL